MSQGQLAYIPLRQIRENPVALRPVDKSQVEYIELVDSIRVHGVLSAISVRQLDITTDDGLPLYSIMDGLHRFTASIDAGKDEIPAQVLNKSDAEVLEAQIVANLHTIETKPVQYAKQLIRMLHMRPDMTMSELAGRINKSTTWLNERFNLVKLPENIAKLVNDGAMTVSNAIALSKLPAEMQQDMVQRAMTEGQADFVPACAAIIKQHKDALRAGRDPNQVAVYQHNIRFRKMGEVEDALENVAIFAPTLIAKANAGDSVAIVKAALEWALSSDPDTVTAGKAKWEADRKLAADKKEAAKKEREDKRKQEAAAKLVGV